MKALFWLASFALAQDLTYTRLPAGDLAPSARVDGTLAFDPAAGSLYLFGGQADVALNDLWTYSVAQRRWQRLAPASDLPPARFGHTLTWDARRARLILFGGQSRGFFSDVWAFDPARNAWQMLARDDAGPSRRYGHSAIADPTRDRLIISHGFTSSGRFDDTWAFDLAANAWRDISPSGPRPLRRCLHHAVLDPTRQQMLLYGGCASGFGPCPLGDLWAFDLLTHRWTERSTQPAPPPREHYGLSFSDGRFTIFGGSGASVFNDTWQHDGVRWQPATLRGELPVPRARHESAANFFFGGRLATGDLTNELWMLGRGLRLDGLTSAFAPTGPPFAPGQLVSLYGAGLGPAQVTIQNQPLPLLYASDTQLNLQLPLAIPPSVDLAVSVNGQTVTLPLTLVPARPSVFPLAWNTDGSINSPDRPSRVLTLYVTGHGSQPLTSVTIDGEPTRLVSQSPVPEASGVLRVEIEAHRSGEVRVFSGLAASQPGVLVYI